MLHTVVIRTKLGLRHLLTRKYSSQRFMVENVLVVVEVLASVGKVEAEIVDDSV